MFAPSKYSPDHTGASSRSQRKCAVFFQPKLTVNAPGDTYEQEADRVADQVMRQREDVASKTPCAQCSLIQRSIASPWSLSDGDVEEGTDDSLQTKRDSVTGDWADRDVSDLINPAIRQTGAPLPADIQRFMERRMGYDFAQVQIHTDSVANRAARAVQARAFTKDNHIVFDAGQYAPHTNSGKSLLAHELTHVVQQGKARRESPQRQGAQIGLSGIQRCGGAADIQRVQWGSARDTGRDAYPWGRPLGVSGDVYTVNTDAGTPIDAWRPHDGVTYWCHGWTFGGSRAKRGPFSIWGSEVSTVLNDEGWRPAQSCLAQPGQDILVFWDAQNQLAHTGVVNSLSAPGAVVNDDKSTLDSKWGYDPRNQKSWGENAANYGRYRVYSKNPASGPCGGKGANEL
ncbi:MAG: DUF4157 domain-containing protein [Saprospiraceae bacterium]